jgi:hypothetical protein
MDYILGISTPVFIGVAVIFIVSVGAFWLYEVGKERGRKGK